MPRPRLVALFGLLSLFLPLSGCTARGGATPEPRYEPVSPALWSDLEGVWLGRGGVHIGHRTYGAGLTASLTRRRSAMELGFPGGSRTRARLEVLGARGDTLYFRGTNAEYEDMDPARVPHMPVGWVSMWRTEERSLAVRMLPADTTPDERRRRPRPSVFRVGQPLVPTAGRERTYGGLGVHFYEDWRHREQSGAALASATDGVVDHIRDDILELQRNGWRCVDQVTRTVLPGEGAVIRFESNPMSSRAHLVHSSTPQVRLVVSADLSPNGYVSFFGRDYNHPVVVSENGYDTDFYFRILPPPGALDPPDAPTTVTLLDFTDNRLDMSPSCDLSRFGVESLRSPAEYLEAIGAAVIAVGLEAVRRESLDSESAVLAALAEMGRDAALEATIRQVAPDASDAAVGYFTRWAALVVSRDVSVLSVSRETAAEWLVQRILEDHPEYADQKQLIAFIVDLHLEAASRPGA